jgi:signal transduction histidine kinase
LSEEIEITAYRIIQEALTNAARHSEATEVDIIVQCVDDHLQIIVQDDGQGFDHQSQGNGDLSESGIGLLMMRERVSAVNGMLDICTSPGNGTRIVAEIPIEELE